MGNVKLDNVKRAFEFLVKNYGKEVTLQELASYSGWSLGTVQTYRTKKLKHILLTTSKEKFKISGIDKYNFESFKTLLSQAHREDGNSHSLIIPFSENNLKTIFKKDTRSKTRLKKCECFEIEYKESFNWANKSQYAKTMAAYANAKGGYLIFGISDSSKEIKGNLSSAFISLEVHKVTEYLNSKFSPEIRWHQDTYNDNDTGLILGLLYTEESSHKPVISISDDTPNIKEAEIYYRYPGRTEKIKYPELVKLIDNEKLKERQLWMQNIEKMNQIGISKVSIIDGNTGELSNSNGSFLIDETLLNKINFIKEGRFSEVDGDPTLQIVGKVTPVYGTAVKEITIPTVINEDTIVEGFLENTDVCDPVLYIKEICNQLTYYLPIYYYMHLAGLNIESTIEIINNLYYKKNTQESLLSRLKNDYRLVLCKDQDLDFYKIELRTWLKNKNLPNELNNDSLNHLFQVITCLPKHGYDWDYIRLKLNHYRKVALRNGLGSSYKTNCRKAICYIDKLLYLTQ